MENKRSHKKDFPTQEEWIASMTEEEKVKFVLGCCCYDKETGEGKRVLTLRAARKYNLDQLQMILDYMIVSDKLDIFANPKDYISFGNIMKALKEKTPPPTPEEEAAMMRVWEEFKLKHPDFFEPVQGDEEE